MPKKSAASIEAGEIDQFSRHAEDWWNPHGKFRPLHQLNPLRVAYVRDQLCSFLKPDENSSKCLKGVTVLDVGCGGGLLAEPLARLGAFVSGLDASAATISVAKDHAKRSHLKIDYKLSSVEDLAKTNQKFDVITALEIAEHVADLGSFLRSLKKLLKPNGLLVMSTLNRTPKSFLLGIVMAEYIVGWVPRGTHNWKKFIRPSELIAQLEDLGLSVTDLTGLIFNPLRGEFELRQNDCAVNYMLTASFLN